MVDSVNTVFAQAMARVGPSAVQDAAEAAGISHQAVDPPQCAMALGGLREGVSPLEQAASFATFAAKGTYAPPYAITRIKDRDGKVVYQHSRQTRRGPTEKETGVLNGVLQRVVREGTGTAAAIGRPVAGKTGTTENNGNAWFIGYVPQLSTAVWVGRPEGDVPMTDVHGIAVTGGSFPARIFSRYMRAALADVPAQDLYTVSPDELSLRRVLRNSPDGDRPVTTVRSDPPDVVAPATPDGPGAPPVSFEPPPRPVVEPTLPRQVPVPTTLGPRPTTTIRRTTTTR